MKGPDWDEVVRRQKGVRYIPSHDLRGFDCSDFVQHVLRAVSDDMAAHVERLLGPDRGSPV